MRIWLRPFNYILNCSKKLLQLLTSSNYPALTKKYNLSLKNTASLVILHRETEIKKVLKCNSFLWAAQFA